MKNHILYFLLFFLATTSLANASGTEVIDLVGSYTCQHQGLQASFELEEINGSIQLKYCRTLIQQECFQQRVYGEVADGQIMALVNNEVLPLDHLVVKVIEDNNDVRIEVESDDGITLVFTR